MHIASYSFERVCFDLELMLEGDRWKLGGRLEPYRGDAFGN
jgi:hypothetical protein